MRIGKCRAIICSFWQTTMEAANLVPGAGIECNRLSQGRFSYRVGRMSIRTANLVFPRRIGRGGGDRIHQLYGNKGVLRSTLAFEVTERNGWEFLVPPYCP